MLLQANVGRFVKVTQQQQQHQRWLGLTKTHLLVLTLKAFSITTILLLVK